MRRSRLPAVGVALAVAAALLASVAFAQPAAYRIAPPPGWTRSVEADTLIFAALDDPPSQRRAGKPGTFKALSFRLAFGPQGELLLSDPPIELRLPPAR